ncbi:hypothetical protein SBF1_2360002 [Candidatus Desulfosporosinus infrequens]|uniref:OmpR/PhoB-type domain-containing protein n=1 Tax=Candidatus Desulfosporosinus infrequens TaxID=2043169 RepID=A0A2U3KME8_9FIRM|nr:hypothetical protein SBF1_2360002 [Candidatus Desulfosporosinus infrequens]
MHLIPMEDGISIRLTQGELNALLFLESLPRHRSVGIKINYF